jgi:tRNA (guanine-N7-)-methyltransferase
MRRGHISSAQERAVEEIFPKYQVTYDPSVQISSEMLFGNDQPLILEIGCGMGETTAAIAQEHPEVNFVGCEVFVAGIGALSKRIEEMELKNIRLFRHDAVEVVRDMISPDSLSGVHIYFPDPWRKARHHKRRLVAQPFIHMLASKIRTGGYLHCATDWENYAEQMMEVLSGELLLQNAHEGFAPEPRNPITFRPTTKFNERGNRLGHGCWDLVFIRK